MKITRAGIEEITDILEQTPLQIASSTKSMTSTQLVRSKKKEDWSALEVLAHLRACADVWGRDIEKMLLEDKPTLPEISPRGHLPDTNYLELDFQSSNSAFCSQRAGFLKMLSELDFEDWSRSGRSGERTHTVFSQARRMALHEQKHWEQLKSIAGEI